MNHLYLISESKIRKLGLNRQETLMFFFIKLKAGNSNNYNTTQYIYLTLFSFFFIGRTRTKDKYRVVYSDHQRLELEKEFHYSRYITIRRKAELANSVGLSERQVSFY